MQQDIRFCEVEGKRVAYASIGDGPLLVFGARWITHLEDEWQLPEVRRFFEELAATHRVIRYDRTIHRHVANICASSRGRRARRRPRTPCGSG